MQLRLRLLLMLSLIPCVARGAERPNIVWILSEDNSKHYLKLFDENGAPTPRIEAMARDGIVFERAFSNAPVCSVARTTLITGCYGPRIGTQFHRKMKSATLPAGQKMFTAYLRDAGYYTTNNSKKDYNAVESDGVWDASSKKASWRNRPTADTPFFHMQTFTMSHESSLHFKQHQMRPDAIRTPPDSLRLADYHPDTPTFRHTYARYHDGMGVIDRAVGQLVDQLAEDGLLEDTFIFYFGDHGGVLPRSKGYIYESGLHVPLVVRVPERWRDRGSLARGSRTQGFVNFIDFGPTVLHLAGVHVPEAMDGKPFLGPGVSAESLAKRDEAFGYADRFDEKYDLCRSLRKGRYKYIRNYQAFYPDGLRNNYRYQMLAYQEWLALYKQGKLNAEQRQFFEAKPVEALFDLETDPDEVHSLAADPAHAQVLADLRGRLQARVKSLPDLSFFPESVLIDEALDDPVGFGQRNAERIGRLVDVADLSLLPFAQAKPKLEAALSSDDPLQRYWALIACSCFGKTASPVISAATERLGDEELLVRMRAAEFLGILDARDPRPTFYEVLNTTTSPAEALLTLNSVIYFRDRARNAYPFELNKLILKAKAGEVGRRIEYLQGNN
ncbi:MAG: sulfatase-like hydrolase/transferase [Planctomycetales bacterium]|nr:sulfatase-like hydrolase/transferase [Planctomycetales bacterium]